jgi:hypothetical protein
MRADRRESCSAGETIEAHSVKHRCHAESAQELQNWGPVALLLQCSSAWQKHIEKT